jgi:hypothetical protein
MLLVQPDKHDNSAGIDNRCEDPGGGVIIQAISHKEIVLAKTYFRLSKNARHRYMTVEIPAGLMERFSLDKEKTKEYLR